MFKQIKNPKLSQKSETAEFWNHTRTHIRRHFWRGLQTKPFNTALFWRTPLVLDLHPAHPKLCFPAPFLKILVTGYATEMVLLISAHLSTKTDPIIVTSSALSLKFMKGFGTKTVKATWLSKFARKHQERPPRVKNTFCRLERFGFPLCWRHLVSGY